MNVFKKIYCRIYQFGFKIALPVLPYKIPKILSAVDDILPVLVNKKIGSVLLVTDKNLRALGLTGHLENVLKASGINLAVHDNVQQNPTVSDVMAGADLYREQKCSAIIAFGGGSPIDCAKAIGAKIARPKKSVQQMAGVLKVLFKTPLMFAIPTTAGTGSEATLAAVITDPETKVKHTINDFALIPDFAILDYRLTVGLPAHITAATGMDVLVHLVEAFIGNSTTRLTRRMSIDALRLLNESLLVAFHAPTDIVARENMLLAAHYAGIAFTRSYVGYVHAISHPISARYGVPHGLANAIILPFLLDEYGAVVDKKLARLAKVINLAGATDTDLANAFRAWVKNMNAELNIPNVVKEIKTADIPALAKLADKEANPLYPVPVLFGRNDLEKIIKKFTEE